MLPGAGQLDRSQKDATFFAHAWPRQVDYTSAVVSVLAAISLTVLLTFGTYANQRSVASVIEPIDSITSVGSDRSGVVTNVFVKQGQIVSQGDPLFEVSNDSATAEFDSVARASSSSLRASSLTLEEQRIGLSSELQKDLELQRAAALSIRARLADIESQMARKKRELGNQEEVLRKVRELYSLRHVSILSVQQQEGLVASTMDAWNALQLQASALKQELASAQGRQELITLEYDFRFKDIDRALAENAAALARTSRSSQNIVLAPRGGQVMNISIESGAAVAANAASLSIANAHSQKVLRGLIPGSALESLKLGDRVAIRFSTYPYQRYGQSWGRVCAISSAPAQVYEGGQYGRVGQETMFQLMVCPEELNIGSLDEEDVPLGVQATLVLQGPRRHLWELIVEPLRALNARLETPPA